MKANNILKAILFTLFTSFFGFGNCGGPSADQNDCNGDNNCQNDDDDDLSSDNLEQCQITMCLAGAIDQYSNGNQYLLELCNRSEVKGVIMDCEGEECFTAFDNFLPTSLYRNSVYPTFFQALDRNNDGLVNDKDEQCNVTVIGFSWGGVNAIRLANDLVEDSRISESRSSIDLLVTLDPYQPGQQRQMNVPPTVKKYVDFRHSVASRNDCSNNQFFGPYLGLKPKCLSGMDCTDYDYSISDDMFNLGPNGGEGTAHGSDIGHCAVIPASHEMVISLIKNEEYLEVLPQAVNIQNYSD